MEETPIVKRILVALLIVGSKSTEDHTDEHHIAKQLDHVMDAVNAGGDKDLVLFHSSDIHCIEDMFCDSFLNWTIPFNPKSRQFTVTSNLTSVIRQGSTQSNVVIMTDFATSNQTRSTLKRQKPFCLHTNIWVIPIMVAALREEYASTFLENFSNIQLNSRIYILEMNDSFQWNVLEVYRIPGRRPYLTSNIVDDKNSNQLWRRRIDLMGTTLRVATIHEPPFTYREITMNKTKLSGVYGVFFGLLQTYLNFSTEFIEPEDKAFGVHNKNENTSTGMVRLLSEGKADIVGNIMYQNYQRSLVMSFAAIGRQKLRLYSTSKKVVGTKLVLSDVFALDYWILLLIILISFTIMFSLLTIYITREVSPTQFLTCMVLTVGSILPLDVGEAINQGLSTNKPFRILFISLLLFGGMNYRLFEGQIVSTSVVHRQGQIDSLQDLLKTDDYKFILDKGTYMHQLFQHSESTSPLGQTWNRYIREKPENLIRYEDFWSHVTSEFKNHIAFPMTDDMFTFGGGHFAELHCAFHASKSAIASPLMGIGLQKNSQYYQVINEALGVIIESGHWKKIAHNNINDLKTDEMCENSQTPVIEYSTVGYIFNSFMLFVILSLTVAVAEYLWALKMGRLSIKFRV